MAVLGQEERFPSTRLSAGYGFRKETIAGARHNERDAPIPDVPALATKRGGALTVLKAPAILRIFLGAGISSGARR